MVTLELIDFGANEISAISYNIGKLINLQSLYAGGNRFTVVPRELSLVRNLLVLNMDGNMLVDMSPLITLRKIRFAYLNKNQINRVPSDILELNQTLEYLNLNENKLTNLPSELASMSKLKTLYVRNNSFSSETIEAIRDMFTENTSIRVYF